MNAKQNETIGRTVSDLLKWADATERGATGTPITVRSAGDRTADIEWYGTVGREGPGSTADYQVIVYVISGELMAGGLHRRWDDARLAMGEWTAFDAKQIEGF